MVAAATSTTVANSAKARPVATTDELLERIACFVKSTRVAVFVRRVDKLLLIRPDKTLAINESAVEILEALYRPRAGEPAKALSKLAKRLKVDFARLVADSWDLLETVGAILNEDFGPRPMLRRGYFEPDMVRFPTLAEIALTYGCQNRCQFCYASSPYRVDEHEPLDTAQVKLLMDKIFHEAHVPSLSFTGGEATLRKDLPELISHGEQLGFRVNLITNGIRLASRRYARRLADAGLASAQVSIEAGHAKLHDQIVGRKGAFDKTVAGVRNLKRLGLHVHTNTTLCGPNMGAAVDVIRFVARELESEVLSMNMLIRTGEALSEQALDVRYEQVAEQIGGLLQTAEQEGIKLVWYSPIPYCIFNPVLHGLGAKSCACVDGILSINPAGEVLPCSSFETGIGSLLDQSFEEIYQSRAARYWREKQFVPPVCKDCPDVDVCAGACPLYWDAAGSFAEIPRARSDDESDRAAWLRDRQEGRSYGVGVSTQADDRHHLRVL